MGNAIIEDGVLLCPLCRRELGTLINSKEELRYCSNTKCEEYIDGTIWNEVGGVEVRNRRIQDISN